MAQHTRALSVRLDGETYRALRDFAANHQQYKTKVATAARDLLARGLGALPGVRGLLPVRDPAWDQGFTDAVAEVKAQYQEVSK